MYYHDRTHLKQLNAVCSEKTIRFLDLCQCELLQHKDLDCLAELHEVIQVARMKSECRGGDAIIILVLIFTLPDIVIRDFNSSSVIRLELHLLKKSNPSCPRH